MVLSCGDKAVDGPAVLQLQRWGLSQAQLNLSEFREAFISPTRELLLLLSYECEASLIPLINGDSTNRDDPEGCYSECPKSSSSLNFHSSAWAASSRSDSPDNIPCTYETVEVVSNSAFSLESSSSRSKQYTVVCDVKSLAWGHCGDAYDQHEDVIFRELLFVSGDHGITVHAFCHPDKKSEMTTSFPDGMVGRGSWMEWGPAVTAHNTQVNGQSSLCGKATGTEESNGVSGEENNESGTSRFTSKKWFRTFLTEVETIQSEGNFLTRFPAKSSFPCSAEVVSFSIFDSTSVLLDFFSHTDLVSSKEENCSTSEHVKSLNPVVNSDKISRILSVGKSSSFKCSRVFSSSSHRLIGFILTLVDPIPINNRESNARNTNEILVVVTMIHQWGIQWVSSVKLQDTYLNPGPGSEWSDFQFSDNLLICLNASGLIIVYNATTSELVECLNVLDICGLNPEPNLPKEAKLSVGDNLAPRSADIQTEQDEKMCDRTNQRIEGSLCTKRIFKRLMVASSSSFLAAVDEYGVIYLICPGDYISDKYCSINKLLPNFGLGILVGWEVGGSVIGSQSVLSDLSSCHSLNISSTTNESSLHTGNGEDTKILTRQKWYLQEKGGQSGSYLSGFSAASQINNEGIPSSEVLLNPMRRIILPIDGCSIDDSICFSPLGITRLVKMCNVSDEKGFKIVHTNLHVMSTVHDDRSLYSQSTRTSPFEREVAFVGEAVGCSFQGCFYLVTQDGLFVVLPSVSVSSTVLPVESVGYWQPSFSAGSGNQMDNFLSTKKSNGHWPSWKIEVLDRVILYEGPEEADRMCLENGWDLKIARMRRLQLALDYLKSEEIEQSLEMLVDVNMAEDGILRLLFTAVYQIFCKVGNDNEIALASRLLALAAGFATKMVRKYGLLQHKKEELMFQGINESRITSVPPTFSNKELDEMSNSRRLCEMAHFLEIIRNLQCRLSAKCGRPGQGLVDDMDAMSSADTNLLQDDSHLPIFTMDAVSSEIQNQCELAFPAPELAFDDTEKLALMPVESFHSVTHLDSGNFSDSSVFSSQDRVQGRKMIPFENPKDMMARWEIDNLDLKTVVRDALQSGRLPLAVLQLHLQHLRALVTEKEPHDTFNEIRDVGRAIAYDLFLKGEIGLAISTLQRLGEDIEVSLKQLLFGTVRRSLRMQIAEEMKRYGYLAPYEWKMLERISLIERLYPSSNFWRIFLDRQKEFGRVSSSLTSPEENKLHLIGSHPFNDCIIGCGEIDGVVIGPWANIGSSAFPVVDEDNTQVGYWAAAAIWSDAWDQRTIDRIVLDQPFLMGVHVLWESQLEYHICHNDSEEVFKLLDVIPTSLLSDGVLQISLDCLRSVATVGCNGGYPDYENYVRPGEELDAVCLNIPNIKILKFSANDRCSIWLRMLMEQELAKKFIFMKEYWEDTTVIMSLLARAGFITSKSITSIQDESIENLSDLGFSNIGGECHRDTMQALHKLVIHHCTQYNLPNLLDLYLDHHKLVLDNDSLISLHEAAGDCEWAKWLLLSRIKGCEYDASFSNARSIISHNVVPGSNLSVLEVDEIIRTVDDMAEGGGELAALATLMHAPAPIQKCLCSGSVSRHFSSSAQCTLENLRPALQRFPTLWRTLIAACFGQDANGNSLGPNTSVFGNSALSDYLNWRANVFSSAGRDTSLVQMLPCWFSKAIRRLVQLFVQGPLGWQSFTGASTVESFLHRDVGLFINARENAEVNAISWEGSIQRSVEEGLYASSVEETGFGVEHHLHRGRALAAFNHLLGARVQKLKSGNTHQRKSGASLHGQTNIQSDVQMLLAPVTQSEESLLSSVMPLAIVHFEDSVLVASCAFLLELCGLSASMLRVDIAALRRISSFYKSSEYNEHFKHLSPRGSAFHAVPHEGDITVPLARALADDYLHHVNASVTVQKETPNRVCTNERPSRALVAVLQHLEKASLPFMVEGKTCGSWLLSGSCDGTEIRSQQKATSQRWSLVTSFCQMHQMPLSTKYLAILAKDNDWVGFLTEAQVGGYPFDVIIQVASKEFNDARLKIHILTVLRSMYSTRRKASSSLNSSPIGKSNEMDSTENNVMIPVELFGLLAECEKQKNPGEALLVRAKDLRWSLLAMIASCFPDVSSLSCLTVWLEITAARETSSIKVNDISSQIASNVGAAVEATNSLPSCSRALTFRYNRRNAKRRRLVQPTFGDPSAATPSNVSNTSGVVGLSVADDITAEDKGKQTDEEVKVLIDADEGLDSLSKMVGVLCEQRLFLPLLRAFEMFLPSCSLLPFIRALQAFSQMRVSESSAHLASFSARIKEESFLVKTNIGREGLIGTSWISSSAVRAADAMLSTCPSAYEKRCLLKLLSATDFGDGGSAAAYFRRLYWKIDLAEPSLRKDDDLYLGNEILDDASLLTALENNGNWEQARTWAKKLEASDTRWKMAVHHVTETQAESMVAEWKEFLWDVPEERAALWGHCQTLFLRYSFPALQAGLFFLKHAEAVEKDVPIREVHELLLLSLQWLSGTITQSNPLYPLHLLREIETRVWLLAVESEAQVKNEGDFSLHSPVLNLMSGNSSSIIEWTASIITKMDNHLNTTRSRATERNDMRESASRYPQASDASPPATTGGSTKTKRKTKSYLPSRRPLVDALDKNNDLDDGSGFPLNFKNNNIESSRNLQLQEENVRIEASVSRWEERVGPEELERAVLSLLEFGQVTAARQLQHKLSPEHVPFEFLVVDAALKVADISNPSCSEMSVSMLDAEALSVVQSCDISIDNHDPLQVLEGLANSCTRDCGRGLCKRIVVVVKAANVLGLSFSEAFGKQPLELLQLLSLKAQDSLEEAKLLVQTHPMPSASIAQILAESFLKGLLAAHRGGYMDSQKEEGPAPLLWRISDFLKWAELCPSEPEIGHALMRLVITGQEIPHACEVELLILSHHFYKSSACLDGVDVLVALAATRVESYVSEGDFSCLARLVTGVSNFHALNFILGILVENGQLELLLQKYSAADTTTGTTENVGFRMTVLTSLKYFNPHDLDAFAMVYNHFDMKHETASLLESRAMLSRQQWFLRYDREQNEDLLESMRYFIEAAEVHSTIDAGNMTRRACAQASLLSLQIRMPDFDWLNLSETNARRALVEQSRFQEALIVAEAYSLNQPSEWALVLWNQMLKPELTEQFVAEFVAVLPLQPSMLAELARFYRSEVAARGDQSHFSVWLSPGGLPAEWLKHLGRSFRCLLKRTRDLRLRVQLATVATGFGDIIETCMKALDRVPDTAGPLVLRKGHGGTYLPLM